MGWVSGFGSSRAPQGWDGLFGSSGDLVAGGLVSRSLCWLGLGRGGGRGPPYLALPRLQVRVRPQCQVISMGRAKPNEPTGKVLMCGLSTLGSGSMMPLTDL